MPLRRHPTRSRRPWKSVLPPIAAISALGVIVTLGIALGSSHPESTSAIGAPTATAIPTNSAAKPSELGVRFSASVDIAIASIRFYEGFQNTGSHLWRIWDEIGQVLRTVKFPTEHRVGWSSAPLDVPLHVAAGTQLIASYVAPDGHYADDANGFGDRTIVVL